MISSQSSPRLFLFEPPKICQNFANGKVLFFVNLKKDYRKDIICCQSKSEVQTDKAIFAACSVPVMWEPWPQSPGQARVLWSWKPAEWLRTQFSRTVAELSQRRSGQSDLGSQSRICLVSCDLMQRPYTQKCLCWLISEVTGHLLTYLWFFKLWFELKICLFHELI